MVRTGGAAIVNSAASALVRCAWRIRFRLALYIFDNRSPAVRGRQLWSQQEIGPDVGHYRHLFFVSVRTASIVGVAG